MALNFLGMIDDLLCINSALTLFERTPFGNYFNTYMSDPESTPCVPTLLIAVIFLYIGPVLLYLRTGRFAVVGPALWNDTPPALRNVMLQRTSYHLRLYVV